MDKIPFALEQVVFHHPTANHQLEMRVFIPTSFSPHVTQKYQSERMPLINRWLQVCGIFPGYVVCTNIRRPLNFCPAFSRADFTLAAVNFLGS